MVEEREKLTGLQSVKEEIKRLVSFLNIQQQGAIRFNKKRRILRRRAVHVTGGAGAHRVARDP